jgi:hypothetical protein
MLSVLSLAKQEGLSLLEFIKNTTRVQIYKLKRQKKGKEEINKITFHISSFPYPDIPSQSSSSPISDSPRA